MRKAYSVGIRLYGFGIRLASAFHSKAKLWVEGRKTGPSRTEEASSLVDPIWVHCASLGEFEQGRPIIERVREKYPNQPILLSFFSPSGYEVRKNYDKVDRVVYLPLDTSRHASEFLDFWKPRMAIFVKYEVWHNFFRALHDRRIPLLLISAVFRPDQSYFKPWGAWFRKSLEYVSAIFTQDIHSRELLHKHGILNAETAGDTRFDRVAAIASEPFEFPEIENFIGNRKVLIAGSTWPADENMLASWHDNQITNEFALILAPHEVSEGHISKLREHFKDAVLLSKTDGNTTQANVLIVDSVGLLNKLYRYADVAYIGGGFGAGIHNTLEPAVYGVPVVFGPRHEKFREASDLIECGGAFTVGSAVAMNSVLDMLMGNEEKRRVSGDAARTYVLENTGATEIIMDYIAHLMKEKIN